MPFPIQIYVHISGNKPFLMRELWSKQLIIMSHISMVVIIKMAYYVKHFTLD